MAIKLKSDKSHKRCSLQGIKGKGLPIRLTSITLGLVLLTGCNASNNKSNDEYEHKKDETTYSYTDSDSSSKREEQYEPTVKEDETTESQEIVEEQDEDIIPSDIDLDEVIDVGEYWNGNLHLSFFNKDLDCFFYDKNGEIIEPKEKMTVRELLEIRKIGGIDVSAHNCDWLNYCMNLEELTLLNECKKDELANVKGENLKKLKKLDIYGDLQKKDLKFIFDIPNLEKLDLVGQILCDFEKIKDIKSLKDLTINTQYAVFDKKGDYWYSSYYDYIDFRQFSNLDNLNIIGSDYMLPIYLSSDDIKYLQDENVNITYKKNYTNEEMKIDDAKTLKENNDLLDEMVKELNLAEDATDEQKLHAIVEYLLTEYTYDPDMHDRFAYIKYTSEEEWPKLYAKFYGKDETYGHLYAILKEKKDEKKNDDKEKTVICANFAAGVRALGHRVGLEAHQLDVIDYHSFNMVKVEDAYYYVDLAYLEPNGISTPEGWLSADEVFDFDSIKYDEYAGDFGWYMADPTSYPNIGDNDHNVKDYPIEIDLEENHKLIEEAKKKKKEEEEEKARQEAEKTESKSDTDSQSDTESKSDTDSESSTDSNSDVDSKIDAESEADADSKNDIDSEASTESKSDTDSETETDSKSDVESKSETEIKSEADKKEEEFMNELMGYIDEYWGAVDEYYVEDETEYDLLSEELNRKVEDLFIRMEKENIHFSDENRLKIMVLSFVNDEELADYLVDQYAKREEAEQDLTNKKVPVKVNGKILVVSGAALAGILMGLGILKKSKDKKVVKNNYSSYGNGSINNRNYPPQPPVNNNRRRR